MVTLLPEQNALFMTVDVDSSQIKRFSFPHCLHTVKIFTLISCVVFYCHPPLPPPPTAIAHWHTLTAVARSGYFLATLTTLKRDNTKVEIVYRSKDHQI
jgi:hypothetical protein